MSPKNRYTPFKSFEVAAIFDNCRRNVRTKLMELRQLIFDTAAKTPGVGELEETLKWGQPSYLSKSKSGSTIRIDQRKQNEKEYAIYFHCQTSLADEFKKIYPNGFKFEGNRAIIFNVERKLPFKKISHCIEIALTYHLKKAK